MKKNILISLSAIVLVSCNTTDKKYLITNNQVGILTKDTQVSKLDSLYAQDSLVRTALSTELRYASDQRFLVFEKGNNAKQLLELTPNHLANQEQIIENVQVLDPRFVTEKGISIKSTFADIKKVYNDFDIQASLSSIIVSPKESSLYFVFDKSDLMAKNSNEYTIDDIPDTATIKRLMISWVK